MLLIASLWWCWLPPCDPGARQARAMGSVDDAPMLASNRRSSNARGERLGAAELPQSFIAAEAEVKRCSSAPATGGDRSEKIASAMPLENIDPDSSSACSRSTGHAPARLRMVLVEAIAVRAPGRLRRGRRSVRRGQSCHSTAGGTRPSATAAAMDMGDPWNRRGYFYGAWPDRAGLGVGGNGANQGLRPPGDEGCLPVGTPRRRAMTAWAARRRRPHGPATDPDPGWEKTSKVVGEAAEAPVRDIFQFRSPISALLGVTRRKY